MSDVKEASVNPQPVESAVDEGAYFRGVSVQGTGNGDASWCVVRRSDGLKLSREYDQAYDADWVVDQLNRAFREGLASQPNPRVAEFNVARIDIPEGAQGPHWAYETVAKSKPDARVAELERERNDARTETALANGSLSMAVQRLGGLVEGRPTCRLNFLQRIDELVSNEAKSAHLARQVETLRAALAYATAWIKVVVDADKGWNWTLPDGTVVHPYDLEERLNQALADTNAGGEEVR